MSNIRKSKQYDLVNDTLQIMCIPTTNAMTSDFLSTISYGWVVKFLDPNRTVFTFHSCLYLLCVALAFWISYIKIFKSFQHYWHMVTENIWKVLQVIHLHVAIIQIWWNIFSRIYFWRNLSPRHLRWSSLQTKERQMRIEFLPDALKNS